MHARRSLIALAAVALCSAALAQVPSLGASIGGFTGGAVFSTWNPADAGGAWTFSNKNLTASATGANLNQLVRGTKSHDAGKWYFEVQPTAMGGYGSDIGVATSAAPLGNFVGYTAASYGYASFDGKIWTNNSGSAYGATFVAGDRIGVALDLTANKVYFSKNGVWQNSASPSSGTGGFSISAGSYFPAADVFTLSTSSTTTHILNTGQNGFYYAVPSGFSAWQ